MQLALKFRHMLPNIVREELDSLVATISGFWNVEHNPDGTHGRITVAGLTIAGAGAPLGQWVQMPYDPALFTASGAMTWTVDATDVVTLAYTMVGRTAFVFFNLVGTTIGGTVSTDIFITLPFNPTINAPAVIRIGTASFTTGLAYFLVGQSKLGIQPQAAGNFALGTLTVQGMAVCQV